MSTLQRPAGKPIPLTHLVTTHEVPGKDIRARWALSVPSAF